MRLSVAVFLFFAILHPAVSVASGQRLAASDIIQQQQSIRANVEAGKGNFGDMSSEKRRELLQRQDDVLRMLEGRQSTDDLADADRVKLETDLAWIKTTVESSGDDRMVCRRERTIGSNRTTRICRTAAQTEREREQARERMDNSRDGMVR